MMMEYKRGVKWNKIKRRIIIQTENIELNIESQIKSIK